MSIMDDSPWYWNMICKRKSAVLVMSDLEDHLLKLVPEVESDGNELRTAYV